MRPKLTFGIIGLIGLAGFFAACSAFKNGAPPTGLESQIYNVRTNFLEVVVPRTNYVPVTVLVTNTQGVTAYQTNTVPVVAQVTNEVPQYTYTAKPGASTVTSTIGTVLNTFFPGVGSIAGNGILALIGAWGYVRSSKNYNTSAAIAQEVETLREFIKTLPNGQVIDGAFTQFLTAHQADAGVINQVLTLLQNEVSNPDAQMAARELQNTIAGLTGAATAPKV